MGVEDGLLERKVLLIAAADSTGCRRLLDAETGVAYGCARRPRRREWWQRFRRRVLEVYEHEDESLLFVVRRRWFLFLGYDVRDAEGIRVGLVGGSLLLHRGGLGLIQRERGTGDETTWYAAADHTALGNLVKAGPNMRLTFTDHVADEPFAKMLLLAASLMSA